MNLYEVTISGTQQQVQASKPEVALNQALSNLKYGDSSTRLSSVLKENHSIRLNINIKNLGKMVRIQKIDDRFTRKYILKSEWENREITVVDKVWEVCPDARTTNASRLGNPYQFHSVYNL